MKQMEYIRSITGKKSDWWNLKVHYWKIKDTGKTNSKTDFKVRGIYNNNLTKD